MRVATAVRMSALVMGMTTLAIGCRDMPTSPDASMPSFARGGNRPGKASGTTVSDSTVTVIQRLTPLPNDITVGAWINKNGGSLEIPEAGLKMLVPAGAVSKRTYFTITAHAGNLVSYEFGPHGTMFAVPLQMHQDAKGLNIWKLNGDLTPTVIPVEAAYFPSASNIDEASGTAAVSEFLPTDVDLVGSKVKFQVEHFSGYLLASGRR